MTILMKAMKQQVLMISIFVMIVTGMLTAQNNRSISGNILFRGDESGTIFVKLFKLHITSTGKVRRLSKREIFDKDKPFRVLKLEKTNRYSFELLPPGKYSVMASIDKNKNETLDYSPPEPFGWYTSEMGGSWNSIDLTASMSETADCYLRYSTLFPKEEKHIEHGALRRIKNLSVLQLWGSPEERGYAHGYLVGRQIIDFFEFYIIEDSWRSPKRYQEIFVPFLEKNLNCPAGFIRECDAVIKGMKASGINMKIASLDREFNKTDLLAINAYIERRAAYPIEPSSSCTQFAFWGSQTKGSDIDGGLIAARNMDGECDIRKVTVSHFLLFAVDPQTNKQKRWISAMWPGFIGTISGINEDGLYSMENAGGTGPGPVVKGIVPCSWTQRYLLENESANATPESIQKSLNAFTCDGGGVTAPGTIILWAVPFENQIAPAFVYEGDRFGGVMRMPTDVRPYHPANIMASNHHLKYGYDEDKPGFSFGKPVSFSSRWRYETGMNTVETWSRRGRPIGTAEAKKLLQMVSHGTTEYSVIFLANRKRILIAVDDLKADMWDAPYMSWTEFDFAELF